MIEFSNKILFVGYGAVAECTLPILFKHIKVAPKNVTVIDFEAKEEKLARVDRPGRAVRARPGQGGELDAAPRQIPPAGDLLIDLAWNIDACVILQWCHDHGSPLRNTSVELWDPYAGGRSLHPTERTLYWRHMNVRRMTAKWKRRAPTSVIEHGANPGLISHFTKQGLIDIGLERIAEQVSGAKGRKAEALNGPSRRQIQPPRPGARGQGDPLQRARHPDHRPCRSRSTNSSTPGASRASARRAPPRRSSAGAPTRRRCPSSATGTRRAQEPDLHRADGDQHLGPLLGPNYSIQGMVVRHGEAFTISDKLTVWEGKKAVYRPTVHYAYCPCDEAIVSLNELRGYNYVCSRSCGS
jgi:homospermidine synthase